MLTNCGHNIEKSSSYRWNGAMRGPKTFAIWQYTITGEGALLYKGREYRMPAGHAMMVEVPQKSTYFLPHDSTHWEFMYISLNGSEIMRLWRDAVKQNGPVVELMPDSPPLLKAIKLVQSGFDGQINNPYIASALAYGFTLSLLEYMLPQGNHGQERPDFLNDVISYCLEHPDGDLSVDVLADVAGFSRFHFSREFHRHQGMPPAEFVNQLRIKLAVRLLQTEKLSIKEIADRCGFGSASYFSKVFRKYQGISPGDFRLSS
jgi:AraC family transcriptional regulator